jgi:hypothetical protein
MADNFDTIWQRIATIPLFGKAGEALPKGAALKKAILAGADQLPPGYGDAYTAPLEKALPKLMQAIAHGGAATVETLTAAVYQHQPDSPLVPQLQRFLAVISDLYSSFLDRDKRANIGLSLAESLPPLAMFQNDGGGGPFTLPVDDVTQLIGGSVGVVSMPATYANDPIIWAALTHETGGHDVTHADAGLLEELEAGVSMVLAGQPGNPAMSRDDLANLWAHWIDEASADVYGALNMGPIFATNLAFFFVALNKAGSGTAGLRMTSAYDQSDPNKILDPHPTDILRLHLAIGVIGSLQGLSSESRSSYIADLEALAAKLATGTTIQLIGNVPVLGTNSARPMDVTVPLDFMQQAARSVGGYIATARLNALAGHSIQDIETWDDQDEAIALAIQKAVLAGNSIAGLGDDAQLLAGTTLALLQKPDDYDAITASLAAGLDRSFSTDPVWGHPDPDRAWLRYPKRLTLASRQDASGTPRRGDK